MPIQHTGKIWHNGNLIPWDKAQIHVMSHVIHYGSSVFEGIRCYAQPSGAAVFRLPEHMQRLLDSAKIYRMDTFRYTREELAQAMLDVVSVNGLRACYLRPIALRAFGEIGVNGTKNPVDIYIACWEWGKYLGEEAINSGVDVCISSWTRMAPNTLPALAGSFAKAAGACSGRSFPQAESPMPGSRRKSRLPPVARRSTRPNRDRAGCS